MDILGVRLFSCEFSFASDADVSRELQASPDDKPKASAETEVDIVEAQVAADAPTTAHVAIAVRVTGRFGKAKVWSLLVGFQGVFRLSVEAEISMQDVLKLHGPAQLYAFAREHVADLTRRADIRFGQAAGAYFIPPWNFQSAP